MAQKAKPAQTKSDPVIEALQRELKQQGFYAGDIDGQAGEKTTKAVEARDAAAAAQKASAQRDKELDIKLLEAQGNKGNQDAQAAATAAETARKQRYDDHASSGLGMTAQGAANLAAPAAGTALGMALGRGVNAAMDMSQESKNRVLRGAAEDRMAGRTTVEGARTGARLAGAMPINNTVARSLARAAPHAGLGLISMGKGAQVLHDANPEGEFYPYQADRAAGLGYIGVGAGLGKQGLRYMFAPGVAPDAQAIATINSNQIRRNGAPGALAQALSPETIDLTAREVKPALPAPDAPEAPQRAAPTPGSKAYLQAQAKDLGIKGTSRMTKSQLAEALANNLAEHGAKRTRAPKLPSAGGIAGPAIAAGLAYAATPDRAEAADGTGGGSNLAEKLTNAGVAGGVAGGTGYGISKLAQALGPMAGPALAGAGSMLGPMASGDMTDDFASAENRNWAARNFPEALQFGAVNQAREMATVPTPGARDDASMMARDQAALEERMPMASASALEIPQAPAQDGASPYPPQITGRLQYMIKHGAPPAAIAQFLNQAVR